MRYEDVVGKTKKLARQHGELTVRQIYYQLYPEFNEGYKTARSFYNSYDRMMVRAREKLDVNPETIIDTAREVMGGDYGYQNKEDFINSKLDDFSNAYEYYQRKRWENQGAQVILWIEKDALARIVEDIAREYNVMVCPSRGYSSFSYIWKTLKENHKLKILHYADHDPSGLDMTRDLEKRMSKYAQMQGKETPEVERIALNIDQVREHDLAPNPTKKSTRQEDYIEKYGNKCWELDALDPSVLQDLVRNSIEKEIDFEKWEEIETEEKAERQELRELWEELTDRITEPI